MYIYKVYFLGGRICLQSIEVKSSFYISRISTEQSAQAQADKGLSNRELNIITADPDLP